jgi:hypothetical protein
VGAENFADYRDQLLSWAECEPRLADYCAALDIPQSGRDFAAALKAELTSLAEQVDAGFPTNTELSVDQEGTPHLKKLAASIQPKGLAEFERELRARMPERHLLDILKHTEHWSGYTRHFGPPSGSDPKLANATQRYLFAVFGYGCNLGPTQTARHAPEIATAQVLRRINAQHVNADKLEAAMVDLVEQYVRFALPRLWGSDKTAIADGTHVKLRENNLLGSTHIRYGGYGGIAYHHIRWHLYRLVHQFHHVRRVGGRSYSGCAPEEQVKDSARHPSLRYSGAKRADLLPEPGYGHQVDAAHARSERCRLLSTK